MKIYKALKTIKEECKSHKDNCAYCPIWSDKGCMLLRKQAEDWKLKKFKDMED